MQFIEIHWSSGSIDEARRVSRHLVEKRLVACAQIIPWVESIYIWDDQLETVQETKVVFKTKEENWEKVKTVIEELSQYEVPEITQHPVQNANVEYLEWIEESFTS